MKMLVEYNKVKSEIEYFLVLIYNFKYRYLSYRCE